MDLTLRQRTLKYQGYNQTTSHCSLYKWQMPNTYICVTLRESCELDERIALEILKFAQSTPGLNITGKYVASVVLSHSYFFLEISISVVEVRSRYHVLRNTLLTQLYIVSKGIHNFKFGHPTFTVSIIYFLNKIVIILLAFSINYNFGFFNEKVSKISYAFLDNLSL